MYDYFQEKGTEGYPTVPASINVAVPFSLRKPVKEIKNVKMDNDFASLALTLELHQKYDDAITHTKKMFNYLKSSL